MLPLPSIGSVKTANLAVSNLNGPLECDLQMFSMVPILDGYLILRDGYLLV